MRFNDLVDQIEKGENPDKLARKTIDTLHKDCSVFLKSLKSGQKVFRGTRKHVQYPIEKFTARKDRKPKDMPIEIHNALGKAFKKKFGWNPRTEGVFATGDFSQAENTDYGNGYYFFPIGNFKVIYSVSIGDLLIRLHADRVVIASEMDWKLARNAKHIDKYAFGIAKEYIQDTNKASRAQYTYNELMFKCKSYYLVHKEFVMSNYEEVFALGKP